jgi:hypothetical protein
MKVSELSYIAGFFDGEGSVWVKNSNGHNRYLSCNFTQKRIRVLWYIRNIFGVKGGLYTRHYKKWNTDCSMLEYWGDNARKVLTQILPYLRVKKYEVEQALKSSSPVRSVKKINGGNTDAISTSR